EAGFFPGIILYLTYWFTSRERAWAVSCFMVASPINGILGGPLSGAIMQFMDGVGGLSGWQWLFLLEGIPAVILGIVTLFYLTDRPELAGWLTADERTWLVARMALEEKYKQDRHGLTLLNAFTDHRVWLLIALYFTIAIGANAFGFYLPKLIKDKFPEQREFQIGLLAAIPNLCAAVCMILNGIHSDRSGERRWHIALPAFLAALGWTLTAWLDDPAFYLAALALVQMGIMSMLPVFWTLPSSFLGGVAAAGGIALINSIGNLGGFVGPNIIGQLQRISGDFTSGVIALACILTLGVVLALCVRRDSVRRTNS
ncbi:MAG: MFS transporter, partial [Planctomycetes bacterium]|nr:MFS transporter [Planctomycetota bacterium]